MSRYKNIVLLRHKYLHLLNKLSQRANRRQRRIMRKISRKEYFCFSSQISTSEDCLYVRQSCKDGLYSHCSLTFIFFFFLFSCAGQNPTRERRESVFDHRDVALLLKFFYEHFLHHLLPYWE